MTANGRIEQLGDEDWYRLPLAAGQNVLLETTAHRMLRSPIDTLIEIYDAAGKKLAENDDGFAIDYISMYDYRSMDSRLTFAAPAAGDYFVRVTDQAGSFGPRAVYRLTVKPGRARFRALAASRRRAGLGAGQHVGDGREDQPLRRPRRRHQAQPRRPAARLGRLRECSRRPAIRPAESVSVDAPLPDDHRAAGRQAVRLCAAENRRQGGGERQDHRAPDSAADALLLERRRPVPDDAHRPRRGRQGADALAFDRGEGDLGPS